MPLESAPVILRSAFPVISRLPRCVLVLLLCLPLGGCVATVVGVAVGTTAAVAGAVVTAPIKVGGAVIDAATDDGDEDDESDSTDDN